jgi:dienelactone hydrolase
MATFASCSPPPRLRLCYSAVPVTITIMAVQDSKPCHFVRAASDDPVPEKRWEARIAYYERAMRSVLELIQGTSHLMNVEGLSEVVGRLGNAPREIEDAWAMLVREHGSSIVASRD